MFDLEAGLLIGLGFFSGMAFMSIIWSIVTLLHITKDNQRYRVVQKKKEGK